MDATSDLDEAKQSLRHRATARRRDAAAGDDGAAGRVLAEIVLADIALHDGVAVSGYWPIASEIDVMPLLRELAARGHGIALPAVTGKDRPLVFRAWRDGDAMADGPFGIREPLASAAGIEPQVVLTPLLAFDSEGYRLGYGGGFYDRSLAALRGKRPTLAIGVAWAAQEVPAVPHDGRDQPLDWVATEREAIRMKGGAA
jgi:5-formyltetrahydrofolate cyclo-ligase